MSELMIEGKEQAQGQAERREQGVRGRLGLLAALLLVVFLSALDASIVATVMPTIVGQLGGFELYSWATAAFLLTSTISVLIYGRLADIYGRKPLLLIAIALFLLGSVLCGLAPTMLLFILFRGLQGLGAGGVMPIAITVIGDAFDAETRARISGLFSVAWSTAALMGPLAGGALVLISWRFIFYLNVPILLLAMWIIGRELHDPLRSKDGGQVDYRGAATLAIGVGSLLLLTVTLSNSGVIWPIGLAIASATFIGLFISTEQRSNAPLLPLSLFRQPVLAVTSGLFAMLGCIIFAGSVYIPMYVQYVRGGSAMLAGLALTPTSLSWTVGATLGGRAMLRIGYRDTLLIGAGLMVVGSLLLAAMPSGVGWWYIVLLDIPLGLGMGIANTTMLIAVQDSVGYAQRGVATALTQFANNMGGTVGVAALGLVLNLSLAGATISATQVQAAAQLATRITRNPFDLGTTLDLTAKMGAAPPAALAPALQVVFACLLGLAVAHLLLALLFPTKIKADLPAPLLLHAFALLLQPRHIAA